MTEVEALKIAYAIIGDELCEEAIGHCEPTCDICLAKVRSNLLKMIEEKQNERRKTG